MHQPPDDSPEPGSSQGGANEATFPKGGGAQLMHGHVNHQYFAMLILLRARREQVELRMALEFGPGEKFDDIYLQILGPDKVTIDHHIYMQLKHTSTKGVVCTLNDVKKVLEDKSTEKLNNYVANQWNSHFVYSTNKIYSTVSSEPSTNTSSLLTDDMLTPCPHDLLRKLTGANTVCGMNIQNKKWKRVLKELSEQCRDMLVKNLKFSLGHPGVDELKVLVNKELKILCPGLKEQKKNLHARMLVWIQRNLELGDFIDNAKVEDFIEKVIKEDSIYTVPSKPVIFFHKRQPELEKAERTLSESRGHYQIDLTITGIPGVGKTQLALKIAQIMEQKFQHILWIQAENEDNLKQSFRNLAEKLNIIERNSKDPKHEYIVEKVFRFFGKEHNKCIFIYDNAVDSDKLMKYFPPPLPKTPSIYTIVTSQITDWETNEHLPLKCFTSKEAEGFFDGVCLPKDGAKIAKSLGYLPLALSIALALVKHQFQLVTIKKNKHIYLKNFISTLESSTQEVTNADPKSKKVKIEYPQPIRVMWDMVKTSIQSDKKCGKIAMKILNMMAFMEPENIPLSLFKHNLVGNENDVLEALLLLKSHSLINYKGENNRNKDIIKEEVEEEEEKSEEEDSEKEESEKEDSEKEESVEEESEEDESEEDESEEEESKREEDEDIVSLHRILQDVTRQNIQENNKTGEVLTELAKLLEQDLIKDEFFPTFQTDNCEFHAITVWNYLKDDKKIVQECSLLALTLLGSPWFLCNIIILKPNMNTWESYLGWESEHYLKLLLMYISANKDMGDFDEALRKCEEVVEKLSVKLQSHQAFYNILKYKAGCFYIQNKLDATEMACLDLWNHLEKKHGMMMYVQYRVNVPFLLECAMMLNMQGKDRLLKLWLHKLKSLTDKETAFKTYSKDLLSLIWKANSNIEYMTRQNLFSKIFDAFYIHSIRHPWNISMKEQDIPYKCSSEKTLLDPLDQLYTALQLPYNEDNFFNLYVDTYKLQAPREEGEFPIFLTKWYDKVEELPLRNKIESSLLSSSIKVLCFLIMCVIVVIIFIINNNGTDWYHTRGSKGQPQKMWHSWLCVKVLIWIFYMACRYTPTA